MKRKLILLSGLAIGIYSCNPKDNVTPSLPYDNGVIVVNEGNFFDNNGTLSLLQRNSKTASYDIFQSENARPITGGISGYAEVNGKGIILVDNSTGGQDKIEIVNARTFKSEATILSSEIENPREVIKVSETKAYVTAWDVTGNWPDTYINPGYVAVLDLTTNQLTKKIAVQHGAQSIVKVGNEVFVGNIYSGKTVITVVDVTTDAVKQTIEVGADPNVIGVDANNKLWVYAGGALMKVNPNTKTVENTVTITPASAGQSLGKFVLSKDKKSLYYSLSSYDANWNEVGQIYSAPVENNSITATTPFVNKMFYGMAVDPETGQLYGGLAPSFKQAGYVFRYQVNGTLIDSVKAEIVPAKFFFK
jgi:DNA-binding beta-propeller fold protein YncE